MMFAEAIKLAEQLEPMLRTSPLCNRNLEPSADTYMLTPFFVGRTHPPAILLRLLVEMIHHNVRQQGDSMVEFNFSRLTVAHHNSSESSLFNLDIEGLTWTSL